MDTNKDRIHDDTFTVGQSGAETFGDKGHAMGIPSWTIDGSLLNYKLSLINQLG